MAHILGIGIAVVDLIFEVDGFPPEDSEVRALARRRCRGGNTGNTLTVLADLGHHCRFAGMLSDDDDGCFVRDQLRQHRIDTEYCRVIGDGVMPISYILLNRRNGSRSIVHYRDLPEFSAEDFAAIPLDGLDWIHFEGRNVTETTVMLERLRTQGFTGTVSVELEKPRPDIERLMPLADLLICSRDFARARGCDDGAALLGQLRADGFGAELVCAWGAEGAWGLDRDGKPLWAAARPPARLVDTLGAGDVFNAGLIHGRVSGGSLRQAMDLGCALAGDKCGRPGLEGLRLPVAWS